MIESCLDFLVAYFNIQYCRLKAVSSFGVFKLERMWPRLSIAALIGGFFE